MNDDYKFLIESSLRVSTPTRNVLLERARPDDRQHAALSMSETQFVILRALIDRVLPQSGGKWIDLAARIDLQLHQGTGDGWRYAELPADAAAYQAGLATVEAWARLEFAVGFASLPVELQDRLLERLMQDDSSGDDQCSNVPGPFDTHQMKRWFEDLRADVVRVYMAHPETLSRIGYSGIANGGDGEPKSGFVRVGIGERENWEPVPDTASDS